MDRPVPQPRRPFPFLRAAPQPHAPERSLALALRLRGRVADSPTAAPPIRAR
jgi:hypothetical protein